MRFFGSSLVFHSGHGGVSYSRKTIRIRGKRFVSVDSVYSGKSRVEGGDRGREEGGGGKR